MRYALFAVGLLVPSFMILNPHTALAKCEHCKSSKHGKAKIMMVELETPEQAQMHEGCRETIKKDLMKVCGVKMVSFMDDHMKIKVEYDNSKTSEDKIKEALAGIKLMTMEEIKATQEKKEMMKEK